MRRCGCAVDLGDGYQHPACHMEGAYGSSTGKSGSLVITLEGFRNYFRSSPGCSQLASGAQLWERQALTRARVVYGDAEFGREVKGFDPDALARWGVRAER